MAPVLVASPAPLAGKTTVAVALAHRLAEQGRPPALRRLAGDASAGSDAALFATLPFNAAPAPAPVEAVAAVAEAGTTIVEAPAGDPRELAATLAARTVVVVPYSDPLPADIPSLCRALGDSCAGIVITRVPVRRREATRSAAEALGVMLRGLLPEDRTLAAPSLAAVAEALDAESSFLNGNRDRVIDRPLVSSISADPAQGYFASYNPNAVIVRSDKPDQQLGALNAGAPCLIVTGGLPLLSYVEDRARQEEVPLLRTRLDTVAAIERLEALYGATPLTGAEKVTRAVALSAELDVSALA